MWHIPINASERSLLYAAETFEQYETLLRFFDAFENESNLDWWEQLADDLEDIGTESEETPNETYEEAVVIMESNTVSERNADVPLEIEKDMRLQHKITKSGKISVEDYVEAIAARYPLLGMAVMDESSRKVVEQTALQAIKHFLNRDKVYPWAGLAVLLTTIQYAKDWDRAGNAGFWAYIAEQFGHKDSQQIYGILTTTVKWACQSYNRLFVFDPNGDSNYYSTVLAHALSPSKSFYALCEFLVKFYRNNLDCAVYADDPAIGRMVGILRDRCQGATIEQDEDIRGNIYGVQAGLKVLITTRPGYMKHFLTKALKKIDTLLDGGELPGREYMDVLLTDWFINKMNEPSTPISPTATTITPTTKRNTPRHKRTTDIAFSYSVIRVDYVLDDDNEPALRIPSIRLASRENPVVAIRSDGADVYQHAVGIYGNDYAATSEEVTIPLADICDADLTRLDVIITIDGKQIYTSGSRLRVNALLFKESKLLTSKTIDEGNYTLFAPKSVDIKFQGNIERQRRSYFEQLFDVYIHGEASIFTDGSLLCCSKPPEGSLRFRLPQAQLEYVYRDNSYPIYLRAEFALTAIGTSDGGHVKATLQNGEQLSVHGNDDNLWQFTSPEKDGGYSVTLSDADSGSVFDEIKFYITESYTVSFDKAYYLEDSEDGNISLDINGEQFELPFMDFGAKAKIPFGSGEIHIQIPRIRLLLDGNPIPTDAIWKGDILPSSTLRVLCPESLAVSLSFGESHILRRNSFNGYDYAIGNMVQAYDGNANKVLVSMFVAGETLSMFDIVFKMSLSEPPSFNLHGNTLIWLNTHSFMGDKNTMLKYIFTPRRGYPITFIARRDERTLSEEFPSKSERYRYQVFAQNETAFGTVEYLLKEDYVVFGDRAAVIFKDETLRISKVLMDGNYTEFKPVYMEDITYIGTENLGYTDLSGDYAHYTAKLFFMTRNGRRYFKDLNPVDIYLVSEKAGRIHMTFDNGEGLFIDTSGDYGNELFKYADPPTKLVRFFFIPDFFEYEYSKEMI